MSVKETIYLDSLLTTIESGKPEIVKDSFVLVVFDPNVATVDELNAIGIPKSISKRIIQYRNKGGSFRIKSDVAKMYGMDSTLYRRLFPFIDLPEKLESKKFIKSEKAVAVIQYNLNESDTTSLKSVNGIGSVLAKRIIKYRESLGGFVRFSQLGEVFGLDSLTLKEFSQFYVSDGFVPRKININKASEKELDVHPYLSTRDARAIFTYRAQHGSFTSPEQLSKIKTLSEGTVNKIAPYLSFD